MQQSLPEIVALKLKTMQTPACMASISRFLCYHENLIDIYASKKKMTMMPVNIMNSRRLLLKNLHQILNVCTLEIQ